MNQEPCVSVLMPAYNEEKTIRQVIEAVLALAIVKELIVVDDGSKDRTPDIAEEYAGDRVRVIRQTKNAGKTAAIATALEKATGDYVIIQDADLEYDPREIPSVVEPLIENVADVVYGSRFLVKRATRVLYYYHFIANQFLTTCSNFLTNINMTDIETGYKAFRREVIQGIPLTSRGFGMEVEITASIAKLPLRIYEVPISYYGRTYEEGKKIGWRDGVEALGYILYYNTLGARTPERRSYFAKVRRLLDQ
jgi:glycosyltransferase involved in cell wall biosynthesis